MAYHDKCLTLFDGGILSDFFDDGMDGVGV